MSANSRTRARSVIATLATLALFPSAASAATTCAMALTPVAFGGYDVFSTTPHDTSGTIIVTCSRSGGSQNSAVTIAIGPGIHGGSTSTRKMKQNAGTDLLSYNLFQDAARTILWGDIIGTNAFSQSVSIPNNNSVQLTANIFGRIPAGQNVSVGTYSDNVLVSVLP